MNAWLKLLLFFVIYTSMLLIGGLVIGIEGYFLATFWGATSWILADVVYKC